MKTYVKMLMVPMFVAMAITGCKKEDNSENAPAALVDDNSSGGNGSDDTINASAEPKWNVSKFTEDEKDETNHFSGYLLRFNKDGSAEGFSNKGVSRGSWRRSGNNFVIEFPSAPLNELNNDWRMISETNTRMELEHVSGGDGSRDYLVLANSLLK